MFFATKNLSAQAMEPCNPWEFAALDRVPPKCITDKSARSLWILNPNTTYQCYTGFESVNPNQRISAVENPPRKHHAQPYDIDYPLTRVEIDAAIGRMKIKPQWIERSLSGNWRLVWIFEAPIALPSLEFAIEWLTKLDQIIPFRQVAGLDEAALKAPERLYTNGGVWEKISDDVVPHSLLLGLLQEISAKFDWRSTGMAVPLEVASAELSKKYPRFSEWEGELTLDSMGPSFWVDGSTSPKSAIVRATGIQTFSAHATKPFYDWSELLGHEFVKQYKLEEMGKAVEGIYYDGKSFIRKNTAEQWLWEDGTQISNFLRVRRGLTDRRAKGASYSQIDSAVQLIKDTAVVSSAGSFCGYAKGVMVYNHRKFLNIHNQDVLQPAPESTIWGPSGRFPLISHFYDGFFSSPDQLKFFLSWGARFYKSFYLRDPRSGQAVFIFGKQGRGKTFNTTAIWAPLMGGHAEAKDWLQGEDAFNSELFDVPVWSLDDGTLGANMRTQHLFDEMVKRCVANQSFRSNEKFRKAGQVLWQGRVMCSGNDDAESLRRIPNLDMSMQEKVMLFRVAEERTDGFKFSDEGEMRKQIAEELPHFARYLLDFQTPEECLASETRFGIKAYHEPSLRNSANHSSASATFGEILDETMREFFTREPDAPFWEGTALQLHKTIHLDMTLTEAMRPYNVQTAARNLATLSAKGQFRIEVVGDEHRRLYRIHRDNRYPVKRARAILQSTKYDHP